MVKISLFHLFLIIFISGSGNGDARKGNDAYAEGDFAAAEKWYRSAIAQNPDNARFYFNLGNALAKQEKVEDAIDAFLNFESLTEDPQEKALAEYSIGTLLAGNKNWMPAEMHLRNSLRLNPEDYDAKLNYELVVRSAEKEQQQNEEENEENKDEDQQNQPPPEPTEYALAIKKQADKLVEMRRYNLAYDLMTTAMKVDPSIASFGDFIERLGNIDKINP